MEEEEEACGKMTLAMMMKVTAIQNEISYDALANSISLADPSDPHHRYDLKL